MPRDRSLRPTRSFLSFFCFTSRSSGRNTNNDIPSTPHIPHGQYELHQPSPRDLAETVSNPPQISIQGLAPARTSAQNVSISIIDQENLVISSASPSPWSSPLVNEPPLLTSQPREGHHPFLQSFQDGHLAVPNAAHPHTDPSIPYPSMQTLYPAQSESVDNYQSTNPQQFLASPAHNPALLHPQVERTEQLGIPFAQSSPASQSRPPSPNTLPPGSQHIVGGMFAQASNVSLTGSVLIDNCAPNFTVNISASNFMASLLKETVLGAESDSSDRSMPPRCHPGTRAKIIERCQAFVLTCNGCQKLRWVVGAFGVGKSAIMQSVAEDESKVLSEVIVGATIFFSINGRQDGTKAITTIAYQLCVKLDSYRLFVQGEVIRDPSLLRKSLSKQFDKFIVEPFIKQHLLHPSSRLLIIIDGLDECSNPLTQRELLELISSFCITYPTSPLVWMIASRPEPHITSFFSLPKFSAAYEKEEILVDSEDADEDVKRYLRDSFVEIQTASIALQGLLQWPSESDFSKIADASGGLFAYASAVVRYISDPTSGNPVSQLEDVLNTIETGASHNVFGPGHPMAQLDALYGHIMSRIPSKVMADTRKLLLLQLMEPGWYGSSFRFLCNMLGMSQSTAYGAVHHIHSIAYFPKPSDAAVDSPQLFHKSFEDYLIDFERSGFSPDVESEARQLRRQCMMRILAEAPDGVDGMNNPDFMFEGCYLKNGLGTGDSISLSWPAVEKEDNDQLRQQMYASSVVELVSAFYFREERYQSLFYMRLMKSFFALSAQFPWDTLRDFAFDESRRDEFLEHGILKQLPLEKLEYNRVAMFQPIYLRYRSPSVERPDQWNMSCKHARENNSEAQSIDWSTTFVCVDLDHEENECDYCFRRFTHHFKTRLSDQLVTVLDVIPTAYVVELRVVDQEDGVSEWVYRFHHGEQWD